MDQRITQIRLMTHKFRPYLARLIYSMPVFPRPGLGTMAVDRYGRCYYDPDFVNSLPLEQVAYVLIHEAMHVMLRHCQQLAAVLCDSADPKRRLLANIAADLVVEQLLRGGMEQHMPKGALCVEQFAFPPRLSALEYFRLLEQQGQQQGIPEAPHGQGERNRKEEASTQPELEVEASALGQSEELDDGQGSESRSVEGPLLGPTAQGTSARPADHAADHGEFISGRKLDSELQDARRDRSDDGVKSPDGLGRNPSQKPTAYETIDAFSSSGAGGSCADGIPRSYEEPPDPTWDSYREDQAFRQVEKAIEQHEKQHGVGSVPGQLKLAISGKLRPQPNPWDVLRSAVSSSVSTPVGAPEMTYRRFSRRQQPDLPRLKGRINSQPTAVVILDTSGSMCSGDDQAKALTVIAQGLARLSSFRVFAGDTRVCSDKRVSALSQIEWAGGGGTDMATLIEEVDRKHHPDSIVLVTDGYTPWPKHRPRARVVVALTRPKQDGFPRWARGVEVGGDATR